MTIFFTKKHKSSWFCHSKIHWNWIFYRFSSQSKFQEAEDLLYDGANELFKYKQMGSGTDLSKLFIEVLGKRDIRTDTEKETAFKRIAV